MDDPKLIYECMLDYCDSVATISRLAIGQVWTVCQNDQSQIHSGLAMSPMTATRTLSWSGTLVGQPLKQIASWINDWDPFKAVAGMSAINCSLNLGGFQPLVTQLDAKPNQANLAVFDYFLPQLSGKKVVVVGHYPGIEHYVDTYGWQVLERMPQSGDYPDPAVEYLLPEADWVFLSASTLVNKTFPRLASLAESATTVLMGPTLPWLPELHRFGIDYLAGVSVVDPQALFETACEAGGVRIFETGVRYSVLPLRPEVSMDWLQQQIATHYQRKADYTNAMEQWYAKGQQQRFPDYAKLNDLNLQLSHMDSAYNTLWDAQSAGEYV